MTRAVYLQEVLRVYRQSPQFDFGVLQRAEEELEILLENQQKAEELAEKLWLELHAKTD